MHVQNNEQSLVKRGVFEMQYVLMKNMLTMLTVCLATLQMYFSRTLALLYKVPTNAFNRYSIISFS